MRTRAPVRFSIPFRIPVGALGCLLASAFIAHAPPALAEAYQTGHISSMSTVNNGVSGVLIRLDSGLPSNCTGTPFGWLWIPDGTTMGAYVLGLWLSGSESSALVTVYASGLATNGFCEVTQIQPSG